MLLVHPWWSLGSQLMLIPRGKQCLSICIAYEIKGNSTLGQIVYLALRNKLVREIERVKNLLERYKNLKLLSALPDYIDSSLWKSNLYCQILLLCNVLSDLWWFTCGRIWFNIVLFLGIGGKLSFILHLDSLYRSLSCLEICQRHLLSCGISIAASPLNHDMMKYGSVLIFSYCFSLVHGWYVNSILWIPGTFLLNTKTFFIRF